MLTLEGDFVIEHANNHWSVRNRVTGKCVATGDTYGEAFKEYIILRTEQAKSIA